MVGKFEKKKKERSTTLDITLLSTSWYYKTQKSIEEYKTFNAKELSELLFKVYKSLNKYNYFKIELGERGNQILTRCTKLYRVSKLLLGEGATL